MYFILFLCNILCLGSILFVTFNNLTYLILKKKEYKDVCSFIVKF